MEERMGAINPDVAITACSEFLLPEAAGALLQRHAACDFVVDCIDSVEPKVHLIEAALRRGCPVISAMGAGGKLDPAQVQVRSQARRGSCGRRFC
jgi:tRNA threonylcarbamoyladenosine dehydratase